MDDPIARPAHYTRGKIEVIDFIEDQQMDFRAANVIKYLCRYRFKGKPLEDLKKARWYLDRLIAEEERTSGAAHPSPPGPPPRPSDYHS